MKIEIHKWDSATVTKGWFTKRQAEVYRSGKGNRWRYSHSSSAVGWWLDAKLDRAAHRYEAKADWVPVPKLPQARLLDGNGAVP